CRGGGWCERSPDVVGRGKETIALPRHQRLLILAPTPHPPYIVPGRGLAGSSHLADRLRCPSPAPPPPSPPSMSVGVRRFQASQLYRFGADRRYRPGDDRRRRLGADRRCL